MSTFQANIPTGTVKLNQDYANIQGNMQQLDTSFGINHTPFSSDTNIGKHKFVEMPAGSLPPGLLMGEATIYSKIVNGAAQVFYTPDASGQEIQLTGPAIPQGVFTGTTFLPGGYVLIWDTAAVTSSSSATVTFPFSGFPNNCFKVFTTPVYNGVAPNGSASVAILNIASPHNPTKTTFTYSFNTNSGNYSGFFYIAIGN